MKKNNVRSGSALIVVLGMMAVLMIMAVTFSVFMRTERSGMTNLKHALTARQTTQTAISRVMAAIDQTFVHPTNNWPVPDWNPPYISSWGSTTQFWQNAQITDVKQRATNARLLTDDLSRHLSPSQLALAKNAKVDWVTVRSGVGASKVVTQGPLNDMIVARYAFLAFNTTGLLDMNFGPTTNDADNTEAIVDTSFVIFMEKAVEKYNQGRPASEQLLFPDFIAKRNELGAFSSYAEMWRSLLGGYRYDYDDLGGNDLEADNVVTPDLFNTFSMSLDEVDPDGKMKLFIPQDTSTIHFPDNAPPGHLSKKVYAKLALKKFERIFKNETSGAAIKLAASPLPTLTRAQLATQALIDYIDPDSKSSGGFWLNNPGDSLNYLNYPCTESVPMVNQAFARLEIEPDPTTVPDGPQPNETDPDPAKWYKEWTVGLIVGCGAYDFSPPPNNISGGCSLRMDYEVVNGGEVFPTLWPAPLWEYPSPSSAGMQAFGKNDASIPGGSAASLRAITEPKTIKIKAFAKSWTTDPVTGISTAQYPKFSYFHELDAGGTVIAGQPPRETVRLEVAITATVKKEEKDGSVIIAQKVPATALGDDHRIRVAPGIYHLPARNERTRLGPPEAPAVWPLELGWAVCLDPRFAYNTAGMSGAYPTGAFTPWICNLMCSQQEATLHNVSAPGSSYTVPYGMMTTLAKKLIELEKADGILSYMAQNVLIVDGIFNNFKIGDSKSVPTGSDITNLKMLMEAFAGNNKIYPDVYHSSDPRGRTNDMFIAKGENYMYNGGLAMCFEIPNTSIKSMGEFGNLLIGPWETLSLFAAFAPRGEKIDFHRVSDYFSLKEARFPNESQIPTDGIEDTNLNKSEYFPALHYGKLNLNAQFKVKCDDTIAGSGIRSSEYNFEPLAAVLTGTPVVNGVQTNYFDFFDAVGVASKIYDKYNTSNGVFRSGTTSLRDRRMFRNVSDIANFTFTVNYNTVTTNENPILKEVMAKGAVLDTKRDAFIGNALDHLTTRGQTFTVIIRADAYSPKYGSTSAQGGTTLATEYALVELWRDSEPNRTPSGAYYPEGTTPPVHSWFIRSCRFFSP